jgi:hypothetical protein
MLNLSWIAATVISLCLNFAWIMMIWITFGNFPRGLCFIFEGGFEKGVLFVIIFEPLLNYLTLLFSVF